MNINLKNNFAKIYREQFSQRERGQRPIILGRGYWPNNLIIFQHGGGGKIFFLKKKKPLNWCDSLFCIDTFHSHAISSRISSTLAVSFDIQN